MRAIGVNTVADKCGGVHKSTIFRWATSDAEFPKPFKLNGRTVWDEEDIDSYLLTRKQGDSNET